jgi:plastocyanin
VRFNWASFHTVTFLAGGPPPDLLVPGATPGELLAGPAFFPIPAGPTPPTGPYDGRTPVSSGTPQGDLAEEPPFTLTFTQPGAYEYVCMLHPGMTGSVVVLPSGAATPETPAQATARGQAESRAALGMIESFASQVRPAQTSSRGVGATTVAMGVSLPAAGSKLAFLPGNVTIRRGDIVSFFMADVYEIHTVTFTSGATPPEFIEPVFSVEGAPPQLVIRANIAGAVGGTTYRGEGYWNSGILTGGQSTAVTFDAPPGRYEYLCLVHPFMKGTITITE